MNCMLLYRNILLMFRISHIVVCFGCFIFSLLPVDAMAINTNTERITERDSLEEVIRGQLFDDSLVMDAYFRLGRIYRLTDPKTGLDHFKTGLDIAENNSFSGVVGDALADIGFVYWRLSNFNRSYDFFVEAGDVFKQEGDLAGRARVLNSIGAIFSQQGHYDYALEYYLNALELFEEIDSIALSASVYNNIGMIYLDKQDFENAEYYHQKSLEIKIINDDLIGKGYSYNNLGTIRKRTGEYDEALDYFIKSLTTRQKIGDNVQIANTKRNLAYLNYLK